jgi:hypothetical protein
MEAKESVFVKPNQSQTSTKKQYMPRIKKTIQEQVQNENEVKTTFTTLIASEKANKPSKTLAKVVPKYKLVIRKLPASKDFTREQFQALLESAVSGLGLDPNAFHVDHFIEGKISRKRGPVFSAGFVSVNEAQQAQIFLQQCPSARLFLPGTVYIPAFHILCSKLTSCGVVDDPNAQPEIMSAPYAKSFRLKVTFLLYSLSFAHFLYAGQNRQICQYL